MNITADTEIAFNGAYVINHFGSNKVLITMLDNNYDDFSRYVLQVSDV